METKIIKLTKGWNLKITYDVDPTPIPSWYFKFTIAFLISIPIIFIIIAMIFAKSGLTNM